LEKPNNPPLAAGATSWNPFRMQQKRALFFCVSLLPRFSSDELLTWTYREKEENVYFPIVVFFWKIKQKIGTLQNSISELTTNTESFEM